MDWRLFPHRGMTKVKGGRVGIWPRQGLGLMARNLGAKWSGLKDSGKWNEADV